MTDHAELIARAEASLEGVTDGPWEAALERGLHGLIAQCLPEGGANFVALVGNDEATPEKEPYRFANARFMAASRQHVPDLIAALKASEARVAELLWALQRIVEASDHYGNEADAENKGAETLAYAHKSTCNLARRAIAALKGGDA